MQVRQNLWDRLVIGGISVATFILANQRLSFANATSCEANHIGQRE
jgi:hypothetical protein